MDGGYDMRKKGLLLSAEPSSRLRLPRASCGHHPLRHGHVSVANADGMSFWVCPRTMKGVTDVIVTS
jgi:hypothetical protein